MSNKIAAVVVTYNRRELLRENIDCLLAQKPEVPSIIIIDNHSTDGTPQFISDYIDNGSIEYCDTGSNLGGAGGFHFGVKYAVQKGYSYIWLMDDDCMPSKGALKAFCEADKHLHSNYGFLSSKVLWKDGSLCQMNLQRDTITHTINELDSGIKPVVMASFVSLFLKREVVLALGLPIKEFFIWTDDWEYTRRISRKYPCYVVTDSLVVHKSKSNVGANIATADQSILGRFDYLYRNDVYLYRREGLRGFSYEIFRLFLHCLKVISQSRDNKVLRLKKIILGTASGFNFQPEIEYINRMTQKRIACFVDTPLQILNCVNMIWHDVEGLKGRCDLFIHKQFSGHEDIVQKLRDSELFANVYECNIPLKRDENIVCHFASRVAEIFFPNRFLLEWDNGIPVKNRYDLLLMSAPLRFTVNLFDVNRNADIWFYEDGTVNYYGNILESYGARIKHLMYVLFRKGVETIIPSRVYVNNASLAHKVVNAHILQLPRFNPEDHEYITFIEWLFGRSEGYGDKRIVYLSTPLFEIYPNGVDTAEAVFEETLNALKEYSDKVIIRPHPREPERSYCGFNIDKSFAMWELLCADKISDQHVLIGYFSTAQLTPKFLYDKEPYLIFTYRMYNKTPKHDKMFGLVEALRRSYRNPAKIYDVQTMAEYKHAMKAIMNGKAVTSRERKDSDEDSLLFLVSSKVHRGGGGNLLSKERFDLPLCA